MKAKKKPRSNRVASDDGLERWIQLGAKGFTVSICYGPCGNNGVMFTVDVLTPDFQSFDKPFAARTLEQVIDIAEIEIRERGWDQVKQ